LKLELDSKETFFDQVKERKNECPFLGISVQTCIGRSNSFSKIAQLVSHPNLCPSTGENVGQAQPKRGEIGIKMLKRKNTTIYLFYRIKNLQILHFSSSTGRKYF
jgi:hypothetical protein